MCNCIYIDVRANAKKKKKIAVQIENITRKDETIFNSCVLLYFTTLLTKGQRLTNK